jgi:hypothetical protein
MKANCRFFIPIVLILLFVPQVDSQSLKNATLNSQETLIAITANSQVAWVLCVGKNPTRLEEVYFKGPSNDRIKIKAQERNAFPGFVIEYSYINSTSILKKYVAYEFMNQGKPIPVIFSFNGTLVTGFGDSGSQESELNAASLKEFEKLPSGFQQALKDFYLFCNGTTPGVAELTHALGGMIENELGLKPYPIMDEMIETDRTKIKVIKKEFGLGLGD